MASTFFLGSGTFLQTIYGAARLNSWLYRNKNNRESRRDMVLWVYPAKDGLK